MQTFINAVDSAGGICELCRRMNAIPGAKPVTPQIFAGWKRRGQVPVSRVWQLATVSGLAPWDIRPDVYDRPEVYLAKVSEVLKKQV